MAAIVYQTEKRSGTTYAYESVSFWDKDKKQSRAKRKLIGRFDKESGQIVPTDGWCKSKDEVAAKCKREPVSTIEIERCFYGATYLLDTIGEMLGIVEDLKQCFPNIYKQILSIAYLLIIEDQNPLSRFSK